MIEYAQKKAKQAGADVVFDIGLVEKLSFPDETFDVVISRLVIHHLPDDLKRKAFAEIFRVLKPGGHFLVADFNPPTNPILNPVAWAFVGHGMMHTNVSNIPLFVLGSRVCRSYIRPYPLIVPQLSLVGQKPVH